jgi:hypothetical protein
LRFGTLQFTARDQGSITGSEALPEFPVGVIDAVRIRSLEFPMHPGHHAQAVRQDAHLHGTGQHCPAWYAIEVLKGALMRYHSLLKPFVTSCVILNLALPSVYAAPPGDVQPASPATAAQSGSQLWSYQPVKRPDVPTVQQKDWVRTSIDAFILSQLEAKGLKPSPDADRASFIRRATLDAWGVIPTPEAVKAFVNDRSPDAYEKLVDRLLASPHYGERQARRWLDLARYADSTGFENDKTRGNMYRYRDYVINAFNQDKPYDQFVKEQIAGDEIAPGNQEVMVATGFLAGYPDNHNARDLVGRKYQITTDMTDTVGAVFLAQTVACARCHNHKFDKISEKEYFQLQAFFANTSEVSNIPAKVGPEEIAYRKQMAEWQEAAKDVIARRKALIDSIRPEGTRYYHQRYMTDAQVSIFKPQEQWTAFDRWINHRVDYITTDESVASFLDMAGANPKAKEFKPEYAEKLEQYKKLNEELRKFDKFKPAKGSDTFTAMTELGKPDSPPTFLLFGGNNDKPLEEVQPAFPQAIANGDQPVIVPTATSSGRRTALANWIASPNNPLTARVFVNRVWAQYFDRGIVETVSNFGKAGSKPTNPELLDFLADNFVKEGWSVKKLHREILLSSVYRESSAYREDAYKADPDNKLLAVFPRARMEAEEIRDSLLAAAGKLDDDTVGGPSVFPPVPKGLNAGNLWQTSKDTHDYNRRSLYIFTRRSVPYPMLETFDMASSQQVHSQRVATTNALQALTLYNNDQVFGWSQALASRVIREAGDDESARLDRLYQLLFARNPDAEEKSTLLAFLDSQEKVIRDKPVTNEKAANDKGANEKTASDKAASDKVSDGKQAGAAQAEVKAQATISPREAAFVDLVHTVANSNDFAYRF